MHIADELRPEVESRHVDAAQECADLLGHVRQHAQMEEEGWDVPPESEKTPEEREVEHLPDAADLKKVFQAETSEPMKPFGADNHVTVTTLHATM